MLATIAAVPPDFFDVVHTQRAARSFLPDDVDDATVVRILTAATHAPSAENSQPFVFVVVRDPALRAAIGGLTARLWQGGARASRSSACLPPSSTTWTAGRWAASPPRRCSLSSAATPGWPSRRRWMRRSSPPCRTCSWPPTRSASARRSPPCPSSAGDELSALLGLPPEVVPVAVVPLGYLPAPLGPPRRRPLSEKAHLNRYGTPFP